MSDTDMSDTDIEELVSRDPEDIWTDGDVDAIDDVFAADFVLHDPASPDEPRGRDDYREYVTTYRSAFPDIEYAVESVVVEGNEVVIRYTARGTHEGELLGIDATGETVEVTGMEQYRVEDGRITEMWTSYDALGLFQQLGVVPPVDELAAES